MLFYLNNYSNLELNTWRYDVSVFKKFVFETFGDEQLKLHSAIETDE